MSYIRLVNVTKKFGDVTAVDNLNIEIGKGECFSMLGPSGCGKTTTLRMVAGFEDSSLPLKNVTILPPNIVTSVWYSKLSQFGPI